jgi:hypothetical protein
MQPEFTYQPQSFTGTFSREDLSGVYDNDIQTESSDTALSDAGFSRDYVEEPPVNTEFKIQPVVPSAVQLRNGWWQREKNLLVGGERYMEPRSDLAVTFAMKSIQPELQLPYRLINQVNHDWLTILLLVAAGLFASIRISWNKYLGNLFLSVANYSTSYRMFNEKNTSLKLGAFQLDVLFYLVFSAFLFQLADYFRMEFPYKGFYLYLYSLGILLCYFLAKKSIYRLTGIVIEKTMETGEYLFHAGNFRRVAGLILIPIVALIAFSPFGDMGFPVWFGMIAVALLYFLLILRGFVILLKKQFPIFYLFLYFCTLEILPLVLLYRILVI